MHRPVAVFLFVALPAAGWTGVALAVCPPASILLIESESGELSEVDLATGSVRRVAAGLAGPFGVALNAAGTAAYVTEVVSGELARIDIATGSVTRVAAGLGLPRGVAVDAAESAAFVADSSSGTLWSVDLATGRVSTVASGLASPFGLALDASGSTAFVIEHRRGTLAVVDLATGKITAAASALGAPFDVTLNVSGTTAYVTEALAGRLSAVDLATGRVTRLASGLIGPKGVVIDPVETTAFVVASSSEPFGDLMAIDFATGRKTLLAAGLRYPVDLVLGPGDCPEQEPPQARAGEDVRLECASAAGALVTLDGSASIDPDSTPGTGDDIASYEWFEEFGLSSEVFLGAGAILSAPLSLGTHVITLRVTDRAGETDTDDVVVEVVDTTPPAIALSLTPSLLWPPDHRMADIEARVEVSHACGAPRVLLSSITSNEPDDAEGPGDGTTLNDIQQAVAGAAAFRFLLRAERAGSGQGRTYTVTYTAVDGSGNSATATSLALVPRDMRGAGGPPLSRE